MIKYVSTAPFEAAFFTSPWHSIKQFISRLSNTTSPAVTPPIGLPIPAASVSVIIPALNESKRIAYVVRYALADPVTAEVIVIDDSSIDDTAALAREAGATVIRSTMLGKGASMQDGVAVANCDMVAYLDGDLAGLRPNIISDLVKPIWDGEADFVKGGFGRKSGRVTELTAKPMLKLFFPELLQFSQPLGGIIAVKKVLLQQLHFEDGYGVDIGLLIDAHLAGAGLVQVDVGSLEHDSQSLPSLGRMAQEVSRVILERAKSVGRLSVDQVMSIFEMERQNQTDIDIVLTKLEGCDKLVLLDMDGTITMSRFVVELAKATGRSEALVALLDSENIDQSTRSQDIAALFRFVHKSEFEKVAHSIEIRDDVIDVVNALRRRGYRVGVVSDSYFVAAEIVRRRIFADFALAHTLPFDAGVCKGEILINRAFYHESGCKVHECCKSNVLRYIIEQEPALGMEGVVAVGDHLNDVCLLKLAHKSFTIAPKSEALTQAPIIEIKHFGELLALVFKNETRVDDTEHQVG